VFANYVGLFTLVRRELKRTMMVINQVIWPPVITTLLYIYVFGLSLGPRIKSVDGVPYVEFLLPGLVMFNVITSSYDETSSSMFQQRFMNSIQELLIAPLSFVEVLVGFLTGSVLRGLVIGNLVMVLGLVLVHVVPRDLATYFYFMTVTALLFSACGLIAGLLGKTFDNLAIINTFVIWPLAFIGGIFSSSSMLPPLLARLTLINPMVYMIDGFRYSYTGSAEQGLVADGAVVLGLAAVALATAFVMMKRGVNLRV
jgi:ABC-2 type transport system permease protein